MLLLRVTSVFISISLALEPGVDTCGHRLDVTTTVPTVCLSHVSKGTLFTHIIINGETTLKGTLCHAPGASSQACSSGQALMQPSPNREDEQLGGQHASCPTQDSNQDLWILGGACKLLHQRGATV